jgi:MFS family permease
VFQAQDCTHRYPSNGHAFAGAQPDQVGKAQVMPGEWIAVFYAVAMAISGTGSLIFGRLFDRFGFNILIGLTMVSALFAPLVFLGGFWASLLGAAIWGIGMGVHESIIPAAVTPMVPMQRRASAFGMFTAGYGVSWFAGSAMIGILYDLSVPSANRILCRGRTGGSADIHLGRTPL